MATLLPSIIDMQRHITSEIALIRQNIHKLEDSISAASAPPISGASEPRHIVASIATDASSSLHDALAQCAQQIRNVDMKLEQYIAHFQVEHSQHALLLHDLTSKLDESSRSEQLRSDLANQKLQDLSVQMEGTYTTSHGDHIRIDVLSSNLQEMSSTIGAIHRNIESIGTSVSDLRVDFQSHQERVNGRLDKLEKAGQPS